MADGGTRVLGMGRAELVAPDWPPLTGDETARLLDRVPGTGGLDAVLWRSPRPLSAGALVRTRDGRRLFVKRHHRSVRRAAALAEEHRFLAHLAARGAPVARVLPDRDGATAVACGPWTYEVHTALPGEDRYRDRFSWTPYLSAAQARSAGAALARLHLAAEGYGAPPRGPLPLLASHEVFGTAGDPVAALAAFAAARPGLGELLERVDWRGDLERVHLRLVPDRPPEPAPLWTHGDWHGSNLLWGGGENGGGGGDGDAVAAVLDFGLANRTTAVHDLATALERCAVEWLRLPELGAAAVHPGQAEALLDGYRSVRPLSPAEAAALPEVLPLVHADYALSEAWYFHTVLGRTEQALETYRDYFTGHAAWFASDAGRAFTDGLRTMCSTFVHQGPAPSARQRP
ncbi:phosphotransferase [Streptacidiphilus sp. ASG 303]|uniref:phosphotransferase enzyme family protein n=1 Tax=Streptacidiphilus sp. ASG 303 TaxID=2896847 RepID=UPI001E48C956|nr:phosphotransferase [Streptacidiphilus sp. ASG 303]MCD0485334.1 phosphotransferase [Streptacidiphilus sp. ASG 303]